MPNQNDGCREHQINSLKEKKYKKEKGDLAKTFSKGDKSEVGHTQPIPIVLPPNKVRDAIKPK
ncbi:hypothetical protein MTR_0490s0050 [Medicago truncatula]|uniref:Uncharacterized protein n=1 Tax=Medicago truncatula TaxID=3880 RepID=A0A072TET8_MEDTR|nr:hypothetical protein MTR_0490s0050 [Medicago truncatula]